MQASLHVAEMFVACCTWSFIIKICPCSCISQSIFQRAVGILSEYCILYHSPACCTLVNSTGRWHIRSRLVKKKEKENGKGNYQISIKSVFSLTRQKTTVQYETHEGLETTEKHGTRDICYLVICFDCSPHQSSPSFLLCFMT